jgi:hypothetical protein
MPGTTVTPSVVQADVLEFARSFSVVFRRDAEMLRSARKAESDKLPSDEHSYRRTRFSVEVIRGVVKVLDRHAEVLDD